VEAINRNQLSIKLLQLSEEELDRVYMNMFNTEEGQLVLEDLRERCYCYNSTIADSLAQMAFNEGLRAVVINIETRLKIIPKPEKESNGL